MDDEMNQINGYTYINDESGFQMAHISLWSLTDVRNILRCIQVGDGGGWSVQFGSWSWLILSVMNPDL